VSVTTIPLDAMPVAALVIAPPVIHQTPAHDSAADLADTIGHWRIVAFNDLAPRLLDAPADRLAGTALQEWVEAIEVEHLGAPPRTWRARSSHGGRRWISMGIGAEQDAGSRVMVCRDSTEELVFERLAYHAGQSVIVLDADGTLRRRFWGRLDNVDDGSIAGDNMLTRLNPDDLAAVMEGAAWLVGGVDRRLRTTVRARDSADPDHWQHLALDAVSALDDPVLEGYVAFLNRLDDSASAGALATSLGTSLADAIPLGVVLADQSHRPIYMNAAARSALGIGVDGLPSDQPWFSGFDPSARERVLTMVLDAGAAGDSGVGADALVVHHHEAALRLHARNDRLGPAATPLTLITLERVGSATDFGGAHLESGLRPDSGGSGDAPGRSELETRPIPDPVTLLPTRHDGLVLLQDLVASVRPRSSVRVLVVELRSVDPDEALHGSIAADEQLRALADALMANVDGSRGFVVFRFDSVRLVAASTGPAPNGHGITGVGVPLRIGWARASWTKGAGIESLATVVDAATLSPDERIDASRTPSSP